MLCGASSKYLTPGMAGQILALLNSPKVVSKRISLVIVVGEAGALSPILTSSLASLDILDTDIRSCQCLGS